MINQILVVLFKEIKCIVRDRKTFIFSLLLPLLLVPGLLLIINFSFNGSQNQAMSNVNIAFNDTDNSFYIFCNAQDNLTVLETKNYKQDLESGKISSYITVDKNLDENVVNRKPFNIHVENNEASINSMISTAVVNYYLTTYKDVAENYTFSDIDDLRTSINVKIPTPYENISDGQQIFNMSSLIFNILIPMMLILYCSLGSISTACDLSAGEKERCTLEALLSTGASRTAIIIGKLLATTATGVISGIFTVLGLYGYLFLADSNSKYLNMHGFIFLFVITIFTSAFFASINLTVGVYAKSYKEAQTYLTPISMICLLPTYFTYTLDANSINMVSLSIPVFNIACIIKEIFSDSINILHYSIVIVWLILYTSMAYIIMAKRFRKENVIFRI